MHLPASLRESLGRALREVGGTPHARIDSIRPVSGGCINNGARLESGGRSYFLKWNVAAPTGMFAAEMDGLTHLRLAASESGGEAGLRVPRPLALDEDGDGPSWLLMEWLEPAASRADSGARLGRALALLHDAEAGDAFGWPEPNWIGSLPQRNAPTGSWGTFWCEQRLTPRLEAARQRGFLAGRALDEVIERTPAALEGIGSPSLLHGDLWSGNTFVTEGGSPALVDPAVYHGHAEVDLAMTELFGGFGADVYSAYGELRPIGEEYRAYRRDLYQLYYLLVHVDLFGGAYVAGTEAAAARVLTALG